jgi:hypothetical protein
VVRDFKVAEWLVLNDLDRFVIKYAISNLVINGKAYNLHEPKSKFTPAAPRFQAAGVYRYLEARLA